GSGQGAAIILDTSTGYSNGAGASIGRFTLAAGRTYSLRADIPYVSFSAATGSVEYSWYNVTTGQYLGSTGGTTSPGSAVNDAHESYAEALLTTTSATV